MKCEPCIREVTPPPSSSSLFPPTPPPRPPPSGLHLLLHLLFHLLILLVLTFSPQIGDISDYVDHSDIEDMSEEELEVAEESFKVSEEGGRKGRGPNQEWFDSCQTGQVSPSSP